MTGSGIRLSAFCISVQVGRAVSRLRSAFPLHQGLLANSATRFEVGGSSVVRDHMYTKVEGEGHRQESSQPQSISKLDTSPNHLVTTAPTHSSNSIP